MTIQVDPELVQEFLQEAHELLETISRQLFVIEEAAEQGSDWSSSVTEIFRAIHTLKGMSAMFGFGDVSEIAHGLEDLLEKLQNAPSAANASTVDILFDGVELIEQRLRTDVTTTGVPRQKIAELQQRVSQALSTLFIQEEPMQGVELDAELLSVLSPEERRRIQQRHASGKNIYRVTKIFEVSKLQDSLRALDANSKEQWEILAYLPAKTPTQAGEIALDLFVATRKASEELQSEFDVPRDSLRPISLHRLMQETQVGLQVPTIAPKDALAIARETTAVLDVRELDGEAVPAGAVRVPIHRLDGLIREVLELRRLRQELSSITEGLRTQLRYSALADRLYRAGREFERRLHSLHSRVLEARMVPMSQVFERVTRMVRQTARALGKEVKIVTTGADTEIDKLIMEELVEPLTHVVRNALDHGVEGAVERVRAGKSPYGTLVFNAYHQGGYVVVEIEDDGRGIDVAQLISLAQARGLLPANAGDRLSEQEALDLIFVSGLSTAAQLSDISGRGVGLDAVKAKVTTLGGMIDVRSQRGIGTKFSMTLPATLSLMSAIVVKVGDQRFAVPVTAIQQMVALSVDDISYIGHEPVLRIGDQVAPLCFLSEVFDIAADHATRRSYVVIVYVGKRRLGLVVNALCGQEDVVVQALGPSIREVGHFLGAADVGDEVPVLVLDVAALTLRKSPPVVNAELAS